MKIFIQHSTKKRDEKPFSQRGWIDFIDHLKISTNPVKKIYSNNLCKAIVRSVMYE